MANENLANALRNAGITEEQLADRIGVDPKSVQRWLAGTTTPYPRHRAAIAQALELTESQLWPQTPITQTEQQAGGHGEPTASNEVTGTWAHATDHGAPDPIELINNTTGPIDLLDGDLTPLLTPELAAVLIQHAVAGRQVRLLTSAPGPQMIPLIGHPNIEIRVFMASFHRSLIHAGDTILLNLLIEAEGDQPPPRIRLDRTAEDGLFDRLTDNYETLRRDAKEKITGPRQLDDYLTNTGSGDPDQDREAGLTERSGPSGPESARARQYAPTGNSGDTQASRRWPRRLES